MISRLLLVGMVGVLGLSLPDGAEWGTGLTWARTDTTACTGRREAVVAFEPIAVDADPINRLADELNRRAEGVDLNVGADRERRNATATRVFAGPVGRFGRSEARRRILPDRRRGGSTSDECSSLDPPAGRDGGQ